MKYYNARYTGPADNSIRNIFTKRKKYYKIRVSYEDTDLIVLWCKINIRRRNEKSNTIFRDILYEFFRVF